MEPDLLRRFLAQVAVPMDRFLDEVERTKPPRVRGTAVFLTHDVDGAPLVLQRHLMYNQALHEKIILLSIITEEVPEVEPDKRVTTEALPQGFHRVRAYYGFMERPDAQEILAICGDLGISAQAEETTYYVDSSRLLPTGPAPMMRWRKRLYQLHGAQRECGNRLLQHPAKPGRRARRADRVLSLSLSLRSARRTCSPRVSARGPPRTRTLDPR